jgi:DNA-directed RNA polymerase subunit RPC12/RpoP
MIKLLRIARRRIARKKTRTWPLFLSALILPNPSCPVLHASVYLLHREKKEWQRGNVCRYCGFKDLLRGLREVYSQFWRRGNERDQFLNLLRCSVYYLPVLRIHDILVYPDPDPRIHASEWWIRIRIRILLFSSLTFKMPTKNKFF